MTGARAALLLAALACGGCSYAFVQAPPRDHAQQAWFDCTTSAVAPAADVLGVLQLAGTALAIEVLGNTSLTGLGEAHGVSGEGRVVQAGLLVTAGVEVASAAYGFRTTAKCRRAKEQMQIHLARPRPRPGCSSDAQCKAGRRCVEGRCVAPQLLPPLFEPPPSSLP